MNFFNRLALVLHKNFLLLKRQKVWLAIWILTPLLLFGLLAFIRLGFDLYRTHPTCHYDAKGLMSAGALAWWQSLLCSLGNGCHDRPTSGDDGGVVGRRVRQSVAVEMARAIFGVTLNPRLDDAQLAPLASSAVALTVLLARLEPLAAPEPVEVPASELVTAEVLINCGVAQPVADVFANSTLQAPFFGAIVVAVVDQLNGSESELFAVAVVGAVRRAVFCDRAVLDASVVSSNNTLLLDLCDLKPIDDACIFIGLDPNVPALIAIADTALHNITGFNLNASTLVDNWGTLAQLVTLYSASGLAQTGGELRRLVELVSAVGNSSNVFDDVTCGQLLKGPLGRFFDDSNASASGAGGAGARVMRKPKEGEASALDPEERKNVSCLNGRFKVASKPECQLFELGDMHFEPVLRGYILLSPRSPVIERVADLMSPGFNSFDTMRTLMLDFIANADQYMAALSDSDLLKALQNGAEMVNNAQTTLNRTAVDMSVLLPMLRNAPQLFDQVARASKGLQDSNVPALLQCVNLRGRVVVVADEHEMEEAAICLQEVNAFHAGIVFEELTAESVALPPLTAYKLRQPASLTDTTRAIRDARGNKRARDDPFVDIKYLTYGFSDLQDLVDAAIVRLQTGALPPVGVYTQQIPHHCHQEDLFESVVARNVPFFMMISWLVPATLICKAIVYEKERRLKEFMKVMGLHNGVHWIAWFIQSFAVSSVSVVGLVLIIKLAPLWRYSDPLLLVVFFLLYICSLIAQSFLISTLFDSANLAAAATGIIFYFCYVPYALLRRQLNTYRSKLLVGVLSQSAFGFGVMEVSTWEGEEEGLQWSNLASGASYDSSFDLLTCFCLLIFDTILYILLALYIETVFPGEYGVPKPFYFPLQKSYWCGHSMEGREASDHVDANNEADPRNFEPAPPDAKEGVVVKQMSKRYGDGTRAVDNLSITFYESQICSFLGHNGAGKTTTMSILTGLYTPTTGSATIYGRDIYTEMDEIRSSMGMCPQHNVLFDKLTVREQVGFYAGLKGVPSDERAAVVDAMIADVGLTKKADDAAGNLSGGMQRKLSVAIAFIGDSKTVVLDEPTAGVDPYARRGIWDLLLKYKPGRTIILSTHHMDEADALGDRIAILAEGRLVCAGSSLFLKHRHSSGYRLRVVLDSQAFAKLNPDADAETHARLVEESVGAELAGSKRMSALGAELVVELPRAPPDRLHAFFAQLERRRLQLCIESYGFSDTSLEEIFLSLVQAHEPGDGGGHGACRCLAGVRKRIAKLVSERRRLSGEQHKSAAAADDQHKALVNDHAVVKPVEANKGEPDERTDGEASEAAQPTGRMVSGAATLLSRRFVALVIKRAHNFRRNPRGMFTELLLPILFVGLGSFIAKQAGGDRLARLHQPPLVMSPWIYGSQAVFTSISNRTNLTSASYGERMLEWPGLGSACIRADPSLTGMECAPRGTNASYPAVPANATYNVNTTCGCVKINEESNDTNWMCDAGEYKPKPPDAPLPTDDTLVDLSTRNISQWLLMTQDQFGYNRIGGYSLAVENERVVERVDGDAGAARFDLLAQLWINMSVGLNIRWNTTLSFPNGTADNLGRFAAERLEARDNVKVWFNNKAWISQPAFTNALNNLVLRAGMGNSTAANDYGIMLRNQPMNASEAVSQLTAIREDTSAELFQTILLLLAFSIIPASFVLSLIDERVSHAKHLQCVSGVPFWLYWAAALVWDLVNFLMPIALILVVFFVFDTRAYVGSFDQLSATLLLLLLYAFAVVPLMYLFTFVFDTAPLAFVVLMGSNFLIGAITTMVMFVLDALVREKDVDPDVQVWQGICSKAFLVLPQFHLGYGMMDLVIRDFVSELAKKNARLLALAGVPDTMSLFASAWSWDVLGKRYVCLLLLGVTFFSVVLLIEYRASLFGLLTKRKAYLPAEIGDEDSDVVAERALNRPHLDEGLVLKDVVKVFHRTGCCKRRALVAVDRLTVGVATGECFGLLGVNGAGKTTVFNMITGKLPLTSGDATFNGQSVRTHLPAVHKMIGYCPQFDALSGLLTGREQLAFYARLRGIRESDIRPVVNWAIRYMNLSAWAHQIASHYSGGNKRKLSTAIALVGCPQFILLDEPSTGMDPGTRRFLWDRVVELRKDYARTVVLTSHSMEECEALCSRAGIVVNGRLQCVGSVQHLKDKFGGGYSLKLKLGGGAPADAEALVLRELPTGAELVDRHHTTLQLRLPASTAAQLSRVFACLQRVRQLVPVEDYALSQTTLDDVFIRFASKQDDMLDRPDASEQPDEQPKAAANNVESYQNGSLPTLAKVPGELDVRPPTRL